MTHGRRNPTLLNSLKEIQTVFHWNNLYLEFKGLFLRKIVNIFKASHRYFLTFSLSNLCWIDIYAYSH